MTINIAQTPPTTRELEKMRRKKYFLRPVCMGVLSLVLLPISALTDDIAAASIQILASCLAVGACFEVLVNQAKTSYAFINYRKYLKLADMTRASTVVHQYVEAVRAQGRSLTNIEYSLLRAQVRSEEQQAAGTTHYL